MMRFFSALVLLVFLFAAHPVLAAPYAYITQVTTGTLTVYDMVKNKKVTTIDVGGNEVAFCHSHEPRWQKGLCFIPGMVGHSFPHGLCD